MNNFENLKTEEKINYINQKYSFININNYLEKKIYDNFYEEIILKEDEECSICLDNENNKTFVKTFCNHQFHKECIDEVKEYSISKLKCPLCRREFEDEIIVFSIQWKLINLNNKLTEDFINDFNKYLDLKLVYIYNEILRDFLVEKYNLDKISIEKEIKEKDKFQKEIRYIINNGYIPFTNDFKAEFENEIQLMYYENICREINELDLVSLKNKKEYYLQKARKLIDID